MVRTPNSNIKSPEPFLVVRDVGRGNRNVMGNYLLVRHVRGLGLNVLGSMLLARLISRESRSFFHITEIGEREVD
jgi:hypothetical protein